MNVFVSSCNVRDQSTRELVAAFKELGITVAHSPLPDPASDPRWRNWYESGLKEVLGESDAFVTVITKAWDCSSWMATEALEGLRLFDNGEIERYGYYNPQNIEIHAAGMKPYLKNRLPDGANKAAEEITGSAT